MDLSTVMWTAAVVGVVVVYWFMWVMGSAEVKGKRAVNLKMGSIIRDKIVQYPLPGYVAPSSISFSPDGRLISYLFSPDGTLHRKVFAFDVASQRQELVFCPPDGGGLDETILHAFLPVYFQEISSSEPELKLTCCASSPIIDPHLSPDGSMLAYVRDDELHVLNPSGGEPK
ncbi:hypothetical protein ZIOFF_050649 [Zingiber officinale]|uniref:Uncharacterized protein n=1 Tax=Zingiber officinale TaxID=94328 RepID=A0A8J5FRD5_ZINOF|nr:hypothetical protein ZIOFF_050649 [Zingiber officinale]